MLKITSDALVSMYAMTNGMASLNKFLFSIFTLKSYGSISLILILCCYNSYVCYKTLLWNVYLSIEHLDRIEQLMSIMKLLPVS